MGNSSQKVKTKFNTWYYTHKNGSTKIGSHMYCPTCSRHFSPNTTYNTLNSHVDTCLAAQSNISNNNAPASLSQINSVADAETSIQNEKFVWVKKSEGDDKGTWEKRPSIFIMEDQYLGDMQADLVRDLNFEDKAKWFKFQYEKGRIPWTAGADYLKISEHNLLKTVQIGIKRVNLHKEVKIVFEEEKGVNDAGGLLREFTHLFCREAFGSDKGLFIKTDTQETIYKINPKIPDSKENLDMFKVVGQVIGKAIFEQITIPAQLDRFLLRLILQSEFTLEDLATVDKHLYNSLKYIRENSITDSDIFEEHFTIYSPVNGELVELIENGSNLRINDDNKEEYIALKLDYIGRKCLEEKIDALLAGLYQVISPDLFQVFTVDELEMILNGLPFIDISDWENNTIYKGSYYKNHQIVKWFWEVMKELNQEQLAKFFHFCTGSLRPPVEGFRALQSNRGEFQKFTIESSKYSKDKSGITAHTCFNRLEIPMFVKKETMKENIYNILQIDFTGVFGIE